MGVSVVMTRSIRDFEGRAVLEPGLAVIVNTGRGDVGVAQPLLDLGDIGLLDSFTLKNLTLTESARREKCLAPRAV